MFSSIKKQIQEFSFLKKDWNSYDAEPISDAVINNALFTLSCLEAKNIRIYRVSPGADGFVSFRIQACDKVIIEVYENEWVLFIRNDKDIIHLSDELDLNILINKLNDYFDGKL